MSNSNKEGALDKKTQEKLKVLFALMALGGKSDREIAKTLGINNTTLSRRRRKLEQEGYIKEYTVIPDFHKLGLNVIVFTFASTPETVNAAHPSEFRALMKKHPQVLCVLEDLGLSGNNWFVISVHKSYDDYIELFNEVQKESMVMQHRPRNFNTHAVMFHTGKSAPMPFSLRNLEALFDLSKQSNPNKNTSDHTSKVPVDVS